MPVTRKPTFKDPNSFISQAKTENKKVKTAKTIDHGYEQKNEEKQKKIKRMTVYMTNDIYLKWKEYELTQLKVGKKISFQSVIESYLKRLLK
jgi:hypothetical protein